MRREIPGIMVTIGTPAAAQVLMENLLESDTTLRFRIISSLNKLQRLHPEIETDTQMLETVLAAEILGHYRSYQILDQLGTVEGEDPVARALTESMQQELERVFRVLGLLYPHLDVHSAHLGLQSKSAAVHDNALEFLDNVLKPRLREMLVPLLDSKVTVRERAYLAQRLVHSKIENQEQAVAALVASDDPWLKSCGAYAVGAFGLRSLEYQLNRCLNDSDPLLRETARAAKLRLEAKVTKRLEISEAEKDIRFGGGTPMCILHRQWWRLVIAALCLISPYLVSAADETTLTREQIKHFLLTAKIVGGKQSNKGITQPWRLTLSDGILTHDASFQAVDEHKTNMTMAGGRVEMNFVDSYKYNIAAYALAELVGLDDMLPVYVERSWHGNAGSLSWWLPVKMDEADRIKQNIAPPDPDAWNNQMYKVRVFDQLVYDDDPNLTNVLIGQDFKIWRVDFSRAFRPYNDLRNSKDLVRCDRSLFEKLKALDANELATKTKGYLSKAEVKAVMARRDKIVTQFQKMFSGKGVKEVLY